MTPEKNEAPAGKEPENPWAFLESPPKEEPERKDVLRLKDVSKSWLAGYILKKGCLTLLILFAAWVACDMFFTSSRYRYDAKRILTNAMLCSFQLRQIDIALNDLAHPDTMPETEPLRDKVERVEITPDMTVADLLREALRQNLLDETGLRCPQSKKPYLVFSEPASVLLQEPEPHNRIPIVMDPPDAHDEGKWTMFVCRLLFSRSAEYAFTARVLYADGGIETISREEAEKLVAKRSPVPFKLDPEPETKEEAE